MSKKYPSQQDVTFILCEDIREEKGSKLSLFGVFGSRIINVLGSRPPNEPMVMGSLSFYFVLADGQGEFDVKVKIEYEDGGVLLDKPFAIVEKEDIAVSAVMAFKVAPMHLKGYGKYTVSLMLDGNHDYRFDFFVRADSKEENAVELL